MKYEWDEAKRQKNIKKHGIDFPSAWDFAWETAKIDEDDRAEYREHRYVAVGYIKERLFVMAFTNRDDVVRLISLRPAEPKEIRRYEKEFD